MINLKSKIICEDEEGQVVGIKKYKLKDSSMAEHLCVIDTLVNTIIENEEDMTINKVCKLIKDNYNMRKGEDK